MANKMKLPNYDKILNDISRITAWFLSGPGIPIFSIIISGKLLRACLKSPGPVHGDVGAGEMQEAEVGFGFFLETNEYFTKPVEPGVGDLHDPSARLIIGMGRLFALLLAPGPDVGDVPLFDRDPAALPIVVALVEAKILRSVVGGLGPVDPNASDGIVQQLEIVDIRSGRDDGERYAPAVHEQGSLRSELSPIRRIRSGGLASERRLGHGPVDALPFPVDSAPGVADLQGANGHGGEDSLATPFREIIINGARGTELLPGYGPPLDSGAENEEYPLEDLPKIDLDRTTHFTCFRRNRLKKNVIQNVGKIPRIQGRVLFGHGSLLRVVGVVSD